MPIKVPEQVSKENWNAIQELLDAIGTDDPSLAQIWACMDSVWDAFDCDNRNLDIETLNTYYSHPVWLLNGLFIEQHPLSLEHRENFSDWVAPSTFDMRKAAMSSTRRPGPAAPATKAVVSRKLVLSPSPLRCQKTINRNAGTR